jgi:hypothetical protein
MQAEEIKAILGPIDEATIADINRTGASAGELAEAWAWMNADEALINEGRSLPSGRVAEVVALLEALEPEAAD